MSERCLREMRTRQGFDWRRGVPAERSRCAGGRFFAVGEKSDRRRLEQWNSAAQHTFGEARHVRCRCKDARMSCDSAHHVSVLVIHLALNNSLAEGPVIFRRWNRGLPFRRRIETCVRHAQQRKDLLPCKKIQRQISLAGQYFAEQNESDVAVLSASTGRCDQSCRERCVN